jgi:2-dehydro-3-deoxygalactonokinase
LSAARPFLAVDWGTTNRRVYRIEDGRAVHQQRDERGVATISAQDFEAEVAAIRTANGDLPMLLAGMVGSDIGWRKVRYVDAPASLADLANAVERIDSRTAIIPGVSVLDGSHADVMRGEEVQLLGAAAARLVPEDALLCQPGTHCKWARLRNGAIASFTTAMTGELFALLSSKGLIAKQLTGEVLVGASFLDGVAEGSRRDLPASLFSVRSRALLGLLDDRDAASYASGMLIGADVVARLEHGAIVHVLADPKLGGFYCAAIEALGGSARLVESEAAFVAGISKVWELAK